MLFKSLEPGSMSILGYIERDTALRLGSETRLGDDYVVWLKIRDHGTEQYAGTFEKHGYCS